ncbi:MAG: flagellar basal body rod protein [Asticcacaulis sp.]|nr:flagellar basal body rod protein [Asticcacaulis sp.]
MSAMQIGAYGAMAASQRFDRSAQQTVNDIAPEAKGDLVTDFVEQINARTAFEASISVIKTADDMVGQLLNIKA